jgi:hypothetical protein
MNPPDSIAVVSILLALQFTAFGWRITREIQMEDSGRRTWFPLPDYLNVACMLAVALAVMVPVLAGTASTKVVRSVLAVSFVLIVFHPITMAAHNRLFSRTGRAIYDEQGRDYPWITRQELVSVVLSMVCAAGAGWLAWTRA